MKKLFLSIAIILTVFSTAFAKYPDVVNSRVAASFVKDFHNVSNVRWSSTRNYIVAIFEMDSQTKFAYYDYQGNLAAVVQHMLTSSLPEDLHADIKKNYSNYWVSELFQVTNEQGIHYYIQLKNADQTLVLTTQGTGSWHAY